MDISLLKDRFEETFFSSFKRSSISIITLILFISIPITYSLVGQRFDLRQRAESPFGTPSSGTPSCQWTKPSIDAGQTAELIVVNYSNNLPGLGGTLSPLISPGNSYKTLGRSTEGNIIYELDAPGTTYTASLIDPVSAMNNTGIKILTSCVISTNGSTPSVAPIVSPATTSSNNTSSSLCAWTPENPSVGDISTLTFSGSAFAGFFILPTSNGLTAIKREGNAFIYQINSPNHTWEARFLDISGRALATCSLASKDIETIEPSPTSSQTIQSTDPIPTVINPITSTSQVNIETYNALIGCLQEASTCDAATKQKVDFFADNMIDAKDLNILLRMLSSH